MFISSLTADRQSPHTSRQTLDTTWHNTERIAEEVKLGLYFTPL
ncbi:MAG: hypothetical protein K0R07_544 [Sedimentibacter sp.]|nr:hypothetical protein [Sedimentibacter sp.]